MGLASAASRAAMFAKRGMGAVKGSARIGALRLKTGFSAGRMGKPALTMARKSPSFSMGHTAGKAVSSGMGKIRRLEGMATPHIRAAGYQLGREGANLGNKVQSAVARLGNKVGGSRGAAISRMGNKLGTGIGNNARRAGGMVFRNPRRAIAAAGASVVGAGAVGAFGARKVKNKIRNKMRRV